jgi:hypothetical protein
MSLLSSFLSTHLIPALEQALIAHEPDVQDAILGEIESLVNAVGIWLESKVGAELKAPASAAPVVKE